jgi:hypothetical protein
MERKKIITGDYEDILTGVRFLEDAQGRIHCMSCMASGMGDTTNNYNTTNSNTEVVDNPYLTAQPVILQTNLLDYRWDNTNTFNRVVNSYTNAFLGYTTSYQRKLHITSILAVQSKGSSDTQQSVLGLFNNGSLLLAFPLVAQLNYKFCTPFIIPDSTYTEFRFKPYNRNVQLSILMIGYLI